MKHGLYFYCFALQKGIITLFLIVIMFSDCRKLFGIEKLSLSGQVIDDITNTGVSGTCSIKVDGYNANATGMLAHDWKENIGHGTINADGFFTVSFSKWAEATTYYFNFLYNNNSYINNGSIYLNTLAVNSNLFANGNYNLNIRVAKITELQINFRNLSPYNVNDLLHIILPFPTDNILFGYLMPRWENLQNCTVDQMMWNVSGGMNTSGTLKCNVPADRRFSIKWQTRKNGIDQSFQDSILCPRNTMTSYSLNY